MIINSSGFVVTRCEIFHLADHTFISDAPFALCEQTSLIAVMSRVEPALLHAT